MAPPANKYTYKPLDVPQVPAGLLRTLPDYWDEVKRMEALAQQKLAGEKAEMQLEKRKRVMADEEALRSLGAESQGLSTDEAISALEDLLMRQGHVDKALDIRASQENRGRQAEQDFERKLGAAGRINPEKAAEMWNSRYGASYGEIAAKPPAQRAARLKVWANNNGDEIDVNEADNEEVESARLEGFRPKQKEDFLSQMIGSQSSPRTSSTPPTSLEESNKKIILRVRPKGQ